MLTTFGDTTFYIITFGCQMNKHDSERVAGMLEALGSLQVESVEEADFVIFMTCCVREAADERLLGQAASIKNYPIRPHSPFKKRFIAIGGCIGQRDGQDLLEKLPHVSVVFGTHNIAALPMLLKESIDKGDAQVQVLEKSDEFACDLPTDREHDWAAWLPITIGCNNFCTYCIVPYVRGREKSRPLEDIIEEAKRYVDGGVREITLLGQNVNSYGRDLYEEPKFDSVLDAISQTGVDRIRFATSHPKDLTDGVIERFNTLPNLMPALHLPAQSGSNSILKAMNRRYTREHYLDLVHKVRTARPDIALSTDIIVGFPGETEQDFLQTCDLVKRVGYNQVFTFIYSPRAGTPAAEMPDDTPREVIQDRFDRLLAIVEAGAKQANERQYDTTVDVLFEGTSKKDPNVLSGKSPFNQTVHVQLNDPQQAADYIGRIVPVHIVEARTWYLIGRFV